MERRMLLPQWMKVFIWLFMAYALLLPLLVLLNYSGVGMPLQMYGFKYGISLIWGTIPFCLLVLFKGFVAYSLWKEKDGAIGLAKIDAIAGIVICVLMMIASLFTGGASDGVVIDGRAQSVTMIDFRFELLFLIPYLITLNRIEYDWG